ncbi:protein DEHYDRATION-INDUCED 19-like isoform X2 [Diospyros lotus]|uniref:protein DEHYDRATION-INDUCED 19-like isoform X2 n=1 Tax=Diospyros lotus TaxID=55363 RepID=UPI00225A34BE|nr:protein DEHYDRATION-INDUCED 19-like isoform X2 [Diospyros lotus]
MDSDFWASRLAAAKRQFTLQNHHQHHGFQLDRLNFDEFEVEDEVRPDFPYPHSYEDFDLASLYSHLEDEQHACESKVARRRRLRRVAIPNSQALSLLGRDLREAHLQMLLGGGGYHSSNANSSANAVTTDPFLSSLILKFPTSESEDISKSVASGAEESSTKSATSSHLWKTSFDPSLSSEEREKRMRQAAGRAGFLQDLLVSTLLGD